MKTFEFADLFWDRIVLIAKEDEGCKSRQFADLGGENGHFVVIHVETCEVLKEGDVGRDKGKRNIVHVEDLKVRQLKHLFRKCCKGVVIEIDVAKRCHATDVRWNRFDEIAPHFKRLKT